VIGYIIEFKGSSVDFRQFAIEWKKPFSSDTMGIANDKNCANTSCKISWLQKSPFLPLQSFWQSFSY